MANLLYLIGKRLIISQSRRNVRGTVIFMLTHLLFIMGLVFTAEIVLLLLGMNDIYVPAAGKLIGWIQRILA